MFSGLVAQRPDTTDLHDEKMGVVDVEAHGAEQVLHPGVVGVDSIDEVLVPTSNYHLSAGGKRTILSFRVVNNLTNDS